MSDLFSFVMMVAAVFRFVGPPTFHFDPRHLLRFSLPLMPGNSIGFAYSWYDRALLVPYVSLTELGVYNVTMTAFGIVSAIPSGIATALYPAYAKIQTVRGQTGLQDAIYVASRYVSFISVSLALGLLATAKPALSLFAGEPCEPGSTALQIATLFFALTVLGNAFGNIFLLLGKTASASATTAVSVVASLAAALLFLPFFDISGAAASRGIGMLVGFVLTLEWSSQSGSLNTPPTVDTCFWATSWSEALRISRDFDFSEASTRLMSSLSSSSLGNDTTR
jgi:O-antigen/teichoic acid export membrane protein